MNKMTDISAGTDTPAGTDTGAAALELRNLHHAYGAQMAVDGIDLRIAPGELVCLLGPSGCGKSTTLRLVAGVERPLEGEVLIDGSVVANGSIFMPPEKRRTGLVFQDFALFPHLSVLDNVKFGLRNSTPANIEARALQALTQVGMQDFGAKFPNMLSGGEQQRVALARALAPRPHLMLMDEPFSGLDRRLRDRIRDETLKLLKQEETATLLVTHDPEEALRMADKIALMRDGKFVQVGTPTQLYDTPVDLQTAAFFSDVNVFHGQVSNGRLETPFGRIEAKGLTDGTDATLAFRPHAIVLSDKVGGSGTVERTRMLGERGLVEFIVAGCGTSQFAAHVAPSQLPAIGATVDLQLDKTACFVFEGHQSL